MDTEASRIHQRLDELLDAIHSVDKRLEGVCVSFDALQVAIARDNADRELTCPKSAALTRIERKVAQIEVTMLAAKWIGGVHTVALLIPGLKWVAERLWTLLLGM